MRSMAVSQARLRFEHLGVGHHFPGDFADPLVLVHGKLAQELVGGVLTQALLLHQQTLGAFDRLALDQGQAGAVELLAHGVIAIEMGNGDVDHGRTRSCARPFTT